MAPLARCPEEVGREELYLKLENLQVTGAYKIRAAFYFLGSLTEEERARGLVLASSGNFGQGFSRGPASGRSSGWAIDHPGHALSTAGSR